MTKKHKNMFKPSSTVCIQDRNGKYWNTTCSSEYTMPEIRNMKRHLEAAKNNPKAYQWLDLSTAKIIVDGHPYQATPILDSDFKLLKELAL